MEKSQRSSGAIVVRVDGEMGELIPGFLENRHHDLRALSEAVAAGDYETIRVLGHRMKGCGGGYGFEGITEIGGWLEQAAKN